jgi:hypothetical protein
VKKVRFIPILIASILTYSIPILGSCQINATVIHNWVLNEKHTSYISTFLHSSFLLQGAIRIALVTQYLKSVQLLFRLQNVDYLN